MIINGDIAGPGKGAPLTLRPGALAARRDDRARIDVQPESVRKGLVSLVLTVVKLLHELLERQAVRRMQAGSLSEADIERLGVTLMRQAEEIDALRREFGLEESDLNLDLGPLGKLF